MSNSTKGSKRATSAGQDRHAPPLWLIIGGKEKKAGWTIVDVADGPHVDYVCNYTDLSDFANNSVAKIYVAQAIEQLDYKKDLQSALGELYRILEPNGLLQITVPDFEILCTLFLDKKLSTDDRFLVMRMMFGQRMTPHDVHLVGFNQYFLAHYLQEAGFMKEIQRVKKFAHFTAASSRKVANTLISLNIQTRK